MSETIEELKKLEQYHKEKALRECNWVFLIQDAIKILQEKENKNGVLEK